MGRVDSLSEFKGVDAVNFSRFLHRSINTNCDGWILGVEWSAQQVYSSFSWAHTGFIREFIFQFICRLPLATDSLIVRIERFIRVYDIFLYRNIKKNHKLGIKCHGQPTSGFGINWRINSEPSPFYFIRNQFKRN